MTGNAFRAVAPVSAVCAAFAAQPSGVPAQRQKIGRCADVRERCESGKHRRKSPADGFRRRKKPQAARQDKAAVSCAPRDGHICPRCGQFGDFAEGLLQARK